MLRITALLPLLAAAPLTLGGCNEVRKITGLSYNEERAVYPAHQYAGDINPAYAQPVAQQPVYNQPSYPSSEFHFNNTQQPSYNYNQPQFTSGQFPTTGHWEWGTAPDGRRTRIWIPDNSYKLPAEAYGPNVPQPWAPPRYDSVYAHDRGRYDTIRLPDGRLEHEWRADEPSTAAQGYWQVLNNPTGPSRTWIPSTSNTASER